MTPEQHSTSSSGWGDTTSNEVADVIGIVASGVVKLETTPDDFVASDEGVVVPFFAAPADGALIASSDATTLAIRWRSKSQSLPVNYACGPNAIAATARRH
jgi:hypothetical protein